MPSQAELQIVIEAQDRASAQLRSLGTDVQRLERQVQSAGGGTGALALAAGAGAAAFFALQAAVQATTRAIGFLGDQLQGGIADNAALERTVVSFQAMAGGVRQARDALAILDREAAKGFNLGELQNAGRMLLVAAQGSSEAFRELITLSERLAVADPAAGIESAAFALREALSGDFTSLAERFEVSRVAIQRWKDQGLPNIEIIRRAIDSLGISAEAVDRLGNTLEARQITVANFAQRFRRELTAGVFAQFADAFGHAVRLIAEHGDRLLKVATDIGAALGVLVQRAANLVRGPLGALIKSLDPQLWAAIEAELSRTVEPVQELAAAAQAAAPAAADLNRELAQIGVQAAEVQLQADRVRRSYDAQLEPLERQLRLLQQSGDVQRVQNALATNRATVEGLRLEREIAVLQQAAGGQEDPAAEGLTLRQRLIALALQERRLRQEELGIEEQRRPAIQTLQERIEAIRDAQRQTLKPLEDQLAIYREQVDVLTIQRQRAELLRQDTEKAAEAMAATAAAAKAAAADVNRMGTGAATPEAVADSRSRGEAIADAWIEGAKQRIRDAPGDLVTRLLGGPFPEFSGGGAGRALGTPGTGAGSGGGGSSFSGEGVTVTLAPGAVQVGDPSLAEHLRQGLIKWLTDFMAAAVAGADAGAAARLQGAR